MFITSRSARRAGLVVAAAALAGAAVIPAAVAEPAAFPTDEHGFVDSPARCDDDQTLVEFGRTARALVAICVAGDGQLEYRGARISDQAGLTMPATRGSGGTVIATNDGVTYSVSKDLLLVSEGDTVLYRETWAEFHQPRFPTGSTTPSSTSSSEESTTASTTEPSTTAAPTTTVSTTTVTPSSSAKAG